MIYLLLVFIIGKKDLPIRWEKAEMKTVIKAQNEKEEEEEKEGEEGEGGEEEGGEGEEQKEEGEKAEEEELVLPEYLPEEEKPEIFSAKGYLRTRFLLFNNLPHGISLTQKKAERDIGYFQSRMRLEPAIKPTPDIKINFQVDILDDVIWGVYGLGDKVVPETSDFPSFYGFTPGEDFCDKYYDGFNISECRGVPRFFAVKRAWGEIRLFFGELRIGRQPSDFGIGIFENDGDGFKNLWGDAHYGSTRDRILFGTKPFGEEHPLIFAIGYDAVSSAFFPQQSQTNQFFIVPYWKDTRWGIGGFLAGRFSKNTEIYALDGYFYIKPLKRLNFDLESTFILGNLGGEIPQIFGHDKLNIFSFNIAGRFSYSWDLFKLMLDGGFSSGDNDPKDKKVNQYPMHPDFNIGLILFEEVLARYTALQAQVLGYKSDFLASRGGVVNSWYVMPTIAILPFETIGTFLSVLVAGAPSSPLLDPQDPTKNILGGKPGKFYGAEIDWGLKIGGENFGIGIQIGYLITGNAFETAEGRLKNIFSTQFRADFMF